MAGIPEEKVANPSRLFLRRLGRSWRVNDRLLEL
jgi:hypothetical protein